MLCSSEPFGKMAAKVSLRQVQEAKRKAEEPATLRKKMLEMEENNRKSQGKDDSILVLRTNISEVTRPDFTSPLFCALLYNVPSILVCLYYCASRLYLCLVDCDLYPGTRDHVI